MRTGFQRVMVWNSCTFLSGGILDDERLYTERCSPLTNTERGGDALGASFGIRRPGSRGVESPYAQIMHALGASITD
jgi:hypothetical protein